MTLHIEVDGHPYLVSFRGTVDISRLGNDVIIARVAGNIGALDEVAVVYDTATVDRQKEEMRERRVQSNRFVAEITTNPDTWDGNS